MFILILLFSFSYLYQSYPLKVDTNTHQIIDEFNRERFFHGFNVVEKQFPYVPQTDKFDVNYSFTDEDMQILEIYGFNIIRLGTEWAGLEPIEGQYNHTYLDQLQLIVEKSASYNIYTLLDFHQDDFSEKYCGEGFPAWLTSNNYNFPIPFGLPYRSYGKQINSILKDIPSQEKCDKLWWPLGQVSFSAAEAYQMLYDNTNDIQQKFAEFWRIVAERFKSEDHVLGYEIMNEPFLGNVWEKPWILNSGYVDYHHLQPLYEQVSLKIRQEDDNHMIFFEPITFNNIAGIQDATGFTQVPGGQLYQNRSVLSFHHYQGQQEIKNYVKNSLKLQSGKMLTEFYVGYDKTGGEQGPIDLNTMQKIMDECDQQLLSWIGWEFKPFHAKTGGAHSIYFNNGTLNLDFIKLAARPYAQIVAGQTIKMNFSNQIFELQFLVTQATFNYESVIFLNDEMHFSSGFDFTVNKQGFIIEKLKPNHYNIKLKNQEQLSINDMVVIKILPK